MLATPIHITRPPSLASELDAQQDYTRNKQRRAKNRKRSRAKAKEGKESWREKGFDSFQAMVDAELAAAYEAVGRAADERHRGVPESATERQRFLVERDWRRKVTFKRHELEPNITAFVQTYQERIHDGYVWKGGWLNDEQKYFQCAFVERGFRSEQHAHLQRVVGMIWSKRSGHMRAGLAKDSRIAWEMKYKALDCVYVNTTTLRQVIRVDIDRAFSSYEELLAKLIDLVKQGMLPCLPHLITWIWDSRSTDIKSPHLVWMLPADRGVFGHCGASFLFDRVAAGLTMACSDIGADIGGLANPCEFKNPLSPHCSFRIPNDTHMPDLAEMAETVDTSTNRAELFRDIGTRALQAGGLDRTSSQVVWAWAARAGCGLVRAEQISGAYDALAETYDPEAHVRHVAICLKQMIPDEIRPLNARGREKAKQAIARQARWVVANFDPHKLMGDPIDRGAARHLINIDDDLATRRDKGQTYAAGVRVENTKAAIKSAVADALQAGRDGRDPYALLEASQRSINTVKKHLFGCYVSALADALTEIWNPSEPTPSVRSSSSSVRCWEGDSCHTGTDNRTFHSTTNATGPAVSRSVRPPIHLPRDPAVRRSCPLSDGPRPIIAQSRPLLSQQLWAAVEAVRGSHRYPDRPTLH